MATKTLVCPVCLNEELHTSKDGGETWECPLCLGIHDGENHVGTRPSVVY